MKKNPSSLSGGKTETEENNLLTLPRIMSNVLINDLHQQKKGR